MQISNNGCERNAHHASLNIQYEWGHSKHGTICIILYHTCTI
jgi:hypothetical protein